TVTLAMALTVVVMTYVHIYRTGYFGWDLDSICSCLKTIESGLSPYYQHNVQKFTPSVLSCTYQAPTYYLFQPVCGWNSRAVVYVAIPILALLLVSFVHGFSLIAALGALGGFAGVLAVATTTNVAAVVEFTLFGFLWAFVARQRQNLAAVALG